MSVLAPAVTAVPLTAAALDQTIAAFNTVEQLLRHLNPDSWRQDLDSLYRETAMYRPRAYQHSRQNKSNNTHTHTHTGAYTQKIKVISKEYILWSVLQ